MPQPLDDSGFLAKLNSDTAKMVRDILPEKPLSQPPTRDLTEAEEYCRQVLVHTIEVVSICDQMVYAVHFLSGYRSALHQKVTGLSRVNYVVYHLEDYSVRVGMVFDRALKLTNTVFFLGLSPHDCRMSTVAENTNVSQDVNTGLKNLAKATQAIRSERNIVVHERRFSDEMLNIPELYGLLLEADKDKNAVFLPHYKREMDLFVNDKKKELSAQNETIFGVVAQLFDALERRYVQVKRLLEVINTENS